MKRLGIVNVRKLNTAHGGHARITSKIIGPNKRAMPTMANIGSGIAASRGAGISRAVVVGAKAATSTL
jgi:hypothetical protein